MFVCMYVYHLTCGEHLVDVVQSTRLLHIAPKSKILKHELLTVDAILVGKKKPQSDWARIGDLKQAHMQNFT